MLPFCKIVTRVFIAACLLFFCGPPSASAQTLNDIKPRMRVIVDNDFSGDPDGLFQLAHILLSPSVEVRGIIGSHLKVGDGFDNSKTQAENAAKKARELLTLIRPGTAVPVYSGSNTGMINDSTPRQSEAVDFLIKEASRTDIKLPLYILCGAGLTEIASALLKDPSISGKATLIWIGGPEYTDLAIPPPGYSNPEYNLNIDITAARVVFNKSTINIWQIPRDAYRQALLPYSVLLTKVKPSGKLGNFLAAELESLMRRLINYKLNIGETYVLGDSPLVLVTALQSSFEPDPSSSQYALKQSPLINNQGGYEFNHKGRPIRVYHRLDVQMMLNDFFAKLSLLATTN
jgi:purine nucleosidase